LARMPQPAGHSRHVEAYQLAFPVTMSSGVWAMEKRVFSGSLVHPAANEKLPIPDILRKVRRFMARKYSRVYMKKNDNYLLYLLKSRKMSFTCQD